MENFRGVKFLWISCFAQIIYMIHTLFLKILSHENFPLYSIKAFVEAELLSVWMLCHLLIN